MKLCWSALILAAVAAGCSSFSHDTVYSGGPGTAFLLVVEDAQPASDGKFDYWFRRVNAAKNGFDKETKAVAFNGLHDLPNDELARPPGLATTLRFAALPLSPGDFALTKRFSSGYTEQGETDFFVCYALGSAVYRIQEGAINVVPTGERRDGSGHDADTIKAQVAAVLATFPKLSAPVVVPDVIGVITFKSDTNLLGNPTCDPDGPVTFTPRR